MAAGIVPSLAIGVGAYCAGELVFHVAKKENIIKKSMNEIIMEAKTKNLQISKITSKIEDPELVNMIKKFFAFFKLFWFSFNSIYYF